MKVALFAAVAGFAAAKVESGGLQERITEGLAIHIRERITEGLAMQLGDSLEDVNTCMGLGVEKGCVSLVSGRACSATIGRGGLTDDCGDKTWSNDFCWCTEEAGKGGTCKGTCVTRKQHYGPCAKGITTYGDCEKGQNCQRCAGFTGCEYERNGQCN